MNKQSFSVNKISVALAVYNEEDNLSNCLNSIKDLADEIVIVDGGSTDKTLDIAKKFNAKIIRTGNPQIFHVNKNKAIDAASSDWILQLDADEVVSEELSSEIKKTTSPFRPFHRVAWTLSCCCHCLQSHHQYAKSL